MQKPTLFALALLASIQACVVHGAPMHNYAVRVAPVAASASAYEDGTLLKGSTATCYVMVNGYRRGIVSAEVFLGMGFTWGAVRTISDAEVATIPQGPDVRGYADLYAEDALLKGPSRPHVYIIRGGRRHHVASPEVFNAMGLDWSAIRTIPDGFLALIPEGPAITSAGKS
jgi:hypothetical protein